MASPLVSVLISVYNAGEYLRESVLSIVDQTYENTEIIIVDDGSTDNCLDYIADVEDGRIRVLRQANSGKSVALNRALEIARGDFYAIHDADDVSNRRRIEKQVEYMLQKPEVAGVFCGYDILLHGKAVAPQFHVKSPQECEQNIKRFAMPSHDPTVMYRLSMVKDFRYDPDLRVGQGYDHILRVGEKYPLAVIGECLYSYRCNSESNTRSDSVRRQTMICRVLEKACQRRGIKGAFDWKSEGVRHRNVEHGLVPHFMESVLDLRCAGKWGGAVRVGIISMSLHALDPYYYKPLVYSLAPMTLIEWYRKCKGRK